MSGRIGSGGRAGRWVPWVLVLGVAALLLGLIRLATTPARSDPRPAGSPAPSEPGHERPDTLASQRSVGASRSATEPAHAVLAEPPAEAATGSSDAKPEPVPEDGLAIQVLLEPSGTPVPGARVWFVDLRTSLLARFDRPSPYGGDPVQRFQRLGLLFEADGEGRVVVPRSRLATEVACEHGGYWGSLYLRGAGAVDSPVLRLYPNESIRVFVSNASGAPLAGIPIGLHYRLGPDTSEILTVSVSGPDGWGEIDRLQHHTRYFWPHEEELAIVPMALLAQRPSVRIEPPDYPESVELALPDTGGVHIRMVDERGEPFLGQATVSLGLDPGLPAAGSPDPEPRPAQLLRDRGLALQAHAEGGSVHFPFVGLGLDVLLLVEPRDGTQAVVERFSGPRKQGEEVELTVRMNSSRARSLVMRLRNEEGDVLADEPIQAWLRSSGRFHQSWLERSGPAGELRLSLNELPPDPLTYSFQIVHYGRANEEPAQMQRSVQGPLAQRDLDWGEVVLARAPLLVAGFVVDTLGQPVADAHVRVQYPIEQPWGTRWTSGVGWESSADVNGAFAVYGTTEAETLRIEVKHPDFAQLEHEARPQMRDLTLVLEGGGRIAGSLLLEEGWVADLMTVRMRHQDSGHELLETPEHSGRFERASLAAGVYDVDIYLDTEPEVAVHVPGVRVVPGETSRDPRLQGVDFRERMRLVELDVRDSLGQPVEEFYVIRRRPTDSKWFDEQEWGEDGSLRLLTTLPELDLLVGIQRQRAELVLGVRERAEVVIGPKRSVRLQLAGGRPELAPDVRLRAALVASDDLQALRFAFGSADIDSDGAVQLAAPVSGRYRVQLMMLSGSSFEPISGVERWVDVPEAGSSQTIVWELPADVPWND